MRDPKNQAEVVKIGVRYVRGVSPALFNRTMKEHPEWFADLK